MIKEIVTALGIAVTICGPCVFAQQPISTTAAASSGDHTNHLTLKVIKVDSEETSAENGRATNAVDGNPKTFWHTQWEDASPAHPHEIIIQFNESATIKGFTYLPRQDEMENGTIKDYEFYVSNDGKDFGEPIKKGAFEPGKQKQTITFEPRRCSFIKLRALSEINGEAWTSVAEIGVVPSD